MSKRTDLHVALPKTLLLDSASKAARRLDVSVDENGDAWIQIEDMFRVLNLSPDRLLSESPMYSLIVKLMNLELKWTVLQNIYARVPEAFDGSDDFTLRIARHMLKHGRRPSQALAMLNPDVIRLVVKLEAVRQNPSQLQPQPTVCSVCGASAERLLRCSACKEMGFIEILYCSKECQVADWRAGHKKRCCKTLMAKDGGLDKHAGSKVDAIEGVMRLCSRMHLAE